MPVSLAEAEHLGHLDQRVLGVHVGDVGAVLLPEVVADPVEEGVAGDLERLVEADEAVGAGLVVLEARLPTWNADEQFSRVLVAVAVRAGRPAVMNGFHVEPGANWPWVARDSSGVPAFSE